MHIYVNNYLYTYLLNSAIQTETDIDTDTDTDTDT